MAPLTEPPLSPADLTAYVRASARLMALPLDDAHIDRVAAHLARTHAMASFLHGAELVPHDEPAELFCPAPFPVEDPVEDAVEDAAADAP